MKMNPEIEEIVDILEGIVNDLSLKPRTNLSLVIEQLKKLPEENIDVSELMKIQEDLEMVSLMPSIDSYSRNEIINVLSMFEMLF